ncbi:hypothetical protein BRADI_3g24676v3 [Brachypodium distachyon]|uniref:Uncharacterized protein n=1 Tax=Brachypodium distachyon TaxID=15368 RepID=A0A0Q3JE22_BRADI|nr:hypothetical protein BRADI_3g24676v3 [Brachypodium distachyon]
MGAFGGPRGGVRQENIPGSLLPKRSTDAAILEFSPLWRPGAPPPPPLPPATASDRRPRATPTPPPPSGDRERPQRLPPVTASDPDASLWRSRGSSPLRRSRIWYMVPYQTWRSWR